MRSSFLCILNCRPSQLAWLAPTLASLVVLLCCAVATPSPRDEQNAGVLRPATEHRQSPRTVCQDSNPTDCRLETTHRQSDRVARFSDRQRAADVPNATCSFHGACLPQQVMKRWRLALAGSVSLKTPGQAPSTGSMWKTRGLALAARVFLRRLEL